MKDKGAWAHGRARILVAVLLALVALSVLFAVGVYAAREKQMGLTTERIAQTVLVLERQGVETGAETLRAVTGRIVESADAAEALDKGDAVRLRRLLEGAFAAADELGVSRLSVLRPDHREIVGFGRRKPVAVELDPFGATFPEGVAGRLTIEADGIPMLTLTIPWRQGERLIGYVELTRGVSGLAEAIHRATGAHILLLLPKDLFKRDIWRDGERAMGRNDGWDQLNRLVAPIQTLKSVPTALALFLEEDGTPRRVVVGGESGRKSLRATKVAMNDLSGNQIGDLVVLRDVTSAVEGSRQIIVITLAVCVVFAIALFFLMAGTFDGMERGQRKALAVAERVFDLAVTPLDLKRLDLRDVVRRAAAAADDHEERRFDLSLPDAPAEAVTDSALLEEALYQLLRNAHDAQPEATVKVTLEQSLQDGASGWIIAVQDEGRGLPAAIAVDINAFMADPHAPRFGAGLPVVGHIARRLGITVETGVGARRGTRVALRCPTGAAGTVS